MKRNNQYFRQYKSFWESLYRRQKCWAMTFYGGLQTSVRRFEKDDDNVINEIAESLYEYNSNNAVTSITHNNASGSQIVKHSYTYDETNNIVEYLNSIDGATSYDYDFLGQLVSADHANQNLTDEAYTYDGNGNRITANGDTYTTGTNNELTSDGDYTYTYDAEGNRTSKTNSAGTERELYTWDHRNRLTTVTKQTYDTTTATWTTVQIVEYTYDYNNVWIRKTLDSNGDGTSDAKTIFIPEAYQTTVQLDDTDHSDAAGPAVTHHYLWIPNQQDKLLADTTSTDVLWSLTDHLGTVRDVLGATTTHLIYDAFGNLISGTNPLLFGFTGKAFDTATNLQNNINRWYDAAVGRWLSTDPIGFEGDDTNLYRFLVNSTLQYIDYDGREFIPAVTDGFEAINILSRWTVVGVEVEFPDVLSTQVALPFSNRRCSEIVYTFTDITQTAVSKATTGSWINNILNRPNLDDLYNTVRRMKKLQRVEYTLSEYCSSTKCCSNTIKILGGRADIDYKVRLFVKGNAREAQLIYQITISYTATLRYEGYYGECK